MLDSGSTAWPPRDAHSPKASPANVPKAASGTINLSKPRGVMVLPPLGVAPAEPVRAGPLGPNVDDAFRLSAQCLNARLSIADGSLNPRRRTAKLLRARGSPGRLRPRCLGGAGIGAVRRRARRIGTPFGDEDLSVRVRPDTSVARLLDGGLRDRDLPPAGRGLAVPLGRRDQREDEYRKAQTTPA